MTARNGRELRVQEGSPAMALATGFGLLALFSLISILLGDDQATTPRDPRDDAYLWMFNLGRR